MTVADVGFKKKKSVCVWGGGGGGGGKGWVRITAPPPLDTLVRNSYPYPSSFSKILYLHSPTSCNQLFTNYNTDIWINVPARGEITTYKLKAEDSPLGYFLETCYTSIQQG